MKKKQKKKFKKNERAFSRLLIIAQVLVGDSTIRIAVRSI